MAQFDTSKFTLNSPKGSSENPQTYDIIGNSFKSTLMPAGTVHDMIT